MTRNIMKKLQNLINNRLKRFKMSIGKNVAKDLILWIGFKKPEI